MSKMARASSSADDGSVQPVENHGSPARALRDILQQHPLPGQRSWQDILQQHAAWEEKRNLINEMGIESVDDLRCMFTTASEADAHGLRRQWLLVHQRGAQTLERACRVKSMERRQVITRPVFTLKVKRHKFCRWWRQLRIHGADGLAGAKSQSQRLQ